VAGAVRVQVDPDTRGAFGALVRDDREGSDEAARGFVSAVRSPQSL
jgi:hypothetical protein